MPQFEKKNDTEDGRAETANQTSRARTSFPDNELAYMHAAVLHYIATVEAGRISEMAQGIMEKLCGAQMRLGRVLKAPVKDTYTLYDFVPPDDEYEDDA